MRLMDTAPPPLAVFTPAERRLIARLSTPNLVQRYLNRLPYNTERGGETLRSFRQVFRHGKAHCSEAALLADRPSQCRRPAGAGRVIGVDDAG